MSKSTFTTNIGPGNTIGAIAIGPGAKAEGEVRIGGPKTEAKGNVGDGVDRGIAWTVEVES